MRNFFLFIVSIINLIFSILYKFQYTCYRAIISHLLVVRKSVFTKIECFLLFLASTYYDDSKSGFELYSITGPPIQRRTPSFTVFEEMVKVRLTFVGLFKAIQRNFSFP